MTTCPHHIDDDPNGPRCLREEHPEHPTGHKYDASSVPDGHDRADSSQRLDEVPR